MIAIKIHIGHIFIHHEKYGYYDHMHDDWVNQPIEDIFDDLAFRYQSFAEALEDWNLIKDNYKDE